MKPIILDMNEMSDSMELYRERPRSLVVYTLYIMCVLMVVVSVLMSFFKVDNVVKSKGVLRDSSKVNVINDISSKIVTCSVEGVDKGLGVSGNTMSFSKKEECLGDDLRFYVELYVNSYDIGKIKEGQEVKFELAAYPASEYGYCKGNVCSISKDVVVDEKFGVSYYVVKVESDKIVDDAKSKNIILRNGMPCKGNIVVGKEMMISYILEKI